MLLMGVNKKISPKNYIKCVENAFFMKTYISMNYLTVVETFVCFHDL